MEIFVLGFRSLYKVFREAESLSKEVLHFFFSLNACREVAYVSVSPSSTLVAVLIQFAPELGLCAAQSFFKGTLFYWGCVHIPRFFIEPSQLDSSACP